MPSQARARRIGERIREELSNLIRREVADPRVGRVTITDVEVDRELAVATIYVTAADASDRSEEILLALDGARGFLRSELAQRIPLRAFPRLRFRWDASVDRGTRIEQLLEELRRNGTAGGEEAPPDGS